MYDYIGELRESNIEDNYTSSCCGVKVILKDVGYTCTKCKKLCFITLRKE